MKDVLFFRGRNASYAEAIIAREEAARDVEELLRDWLVSEAELLRRRESSKGVSMASIANLFVATTIRTFRISMENEKP